jgi:hypothetical protein
MFSSATMKIIVLAGDSHGRDICNDVKHRYKLHTARISALFSSATMKIIVPARDSHGGDICNDVKHRYK